MRTRLRWLSGVAHVVLMVVGVCAVSLALPSVTVAQSAPVKFPHAKHEKLFPQCSGCHAGIPTGDAKTAFPDTATCGECHNNRDQKKVAWSGPVRSASNLKFSHVTHKGQAGAQGATCATCHATPDDKWMHVDRATPAQCQSCHTHKASAHLAPDNRCSTCHVPLTKATALSVARIAAFPKPDAHGKSDFAQRHAVTGADAQAQCQTCHARESCARCHVNATAITTQFQLAKDARVASLQAGRKAAYVVPASHRAADFIEFAHGPAAANSAASCANCHARTSCLTCHTGEVGASTIGTLPLAEPGGVAGIQLKTNVLPWRTLLEQSTFGGRIALGPATQPPQVLTGAEKKNVAVHPAGFAKTHGAQAAVARVNCEGCHTKTYCTQCHAGENTRRFHVANFAARHAPEAYGRETDCAQCHNREVFCRGCHIQNGLASKARGGIGYHSAVPLWTLQHGQAARQGLQSCTSCHVQKDCMQCHAQGTRGVNPHGPNFDAQRLWKANRLICLRCHFKDPLTGQ